MVDSLKLNKPKPCRLTLPLRGVYFDQIKAGTKAFEYRLVTPFWQKRLDGREYEGITLTRGYPSRNDVSRRIDLPWQGCEIQTITHEHFGAEPVQVYAIRVGVITQSEDQGT
jgi:hypothetical protein